VQRRIVAPNGKRERDGADGLTFSVLADETALGSFTPWRARSMPFYRFTLSLLLDYFGPGMIPAVYASVAIDPTADLSGYYWRHLRC
jgi:hypothetical protein